MTLPLPIEECILIALITAIAAAIQGGVGFGFALVCAPLLVLFTRELVPGPILLSAFVLTVCMVLRERAEAKLGEIGWALLGGVPGSAIGGVILYYASERVMMFLVAGVVLLAVLLSLFGPRLALSRRNLFLAGIASGIMGTLAAIGGPPIALLYQHEPGTRIRASMGVYLVGGILTRFVAVYSAGQLGAREFHLASVMVPGVLVGFFASKFIAKKLDRGHTRKAILTMCVLAVPLVVYRAFTA